MVAFLKGAAGALLIALLLSAGLWLHQRYTEFVIMRAVIAQLLQQTQPAPPPPPSPPPDHE